MKKQKLTTQKLSLNKFKIATISNFGKSKIVGGVSGDEDGTDTDTGKKSLIRDKNTRCQKGIVIIDKPNDLDA